MSTHLRKFDVRNHNRDKGRRPNPTNRDADRARGNLPHEGHQPYTFAQGLDVEKAILRKDALARYRNDTGLSDEALAIRLMLPLERLRTLLAGRSPITNELATHIEEMLSLPASWLDEGTALPVVSEAPQSQNPSNALPSYAPPPTGDKDMNTPTEANNARTATRRMPKEQKLQIEEHRRQNLTMLTSQRGTKHRLAQLAGTSGSRISLMTSGRKPVSEPFAMGIEDGLSLPRHWLDVPHQVKDVPPTVWALLMAEPTDAEVPEEMVVPVNRQPARVKRPRVAAPPAYAVAEEHDTVAVIERTPTHTPAQPLATAPAAASIASTAASPMFEKESGKVGAIAEALAKTILRLSATDKLSEARAFQLLGTIIEDNAAR